ncbi:MAG: TlpA disulfide reductase family protein [Mariniphaga sp.]
MRRFTYILIFLSLLGVSCQNRNTCNLKGTIVNCKDSTILYLVDLDSLNFVDSIIVENGTFSHKLHLTHPTKFVLHNKRDQFEFRDRKYFWLEPSEISLNGDFEFLNKLEVNGSVSNMEFEKYHQLLDEANKRINKFEEQIHFKSEDEKVTEQIKIDSLKKELSIEIEHFMIEYKKSYVSLSELHSECYFAFRHLTKEQVKNVYNNFSNELRITVKGNEIKKYMELPEPPKIGDMAPEIIQITPSGDTVRLSDFKGKYVLLDFWSSSCGPCRGEFKWLRKAYDKYGPKGLVILGVSGDNNKQKWVDAIKHDSISWINISDLKGWYNDAFLLYDIKGIPNKFLINPDGMIIKDRIWLSSESITNQVLGEIFEKKSGL